MQTEMTRKLQLQYSYQTKYFKTKAIKKDKEGNYIMIKGSVQEEDFTLVNIYAPNIRASKYIKQTLTDIKGETDGNTIILGDFNTPLTSMDRSAKQKISKATEILNYTTEELELIDIFRTLHMKKKKQNTFFPSAHRTFSRIDHMITC